MRIGPRKISAGLYKKIIQLMPIACVDIVLVQGKKFLLGRRANKPALGERCFPGGRVFRGESLEAAARRHIYDETSIKKIKIKKLFGVETTIFEDSAQGPPVHSVNMVFLAEASSPKFSIHNGENAAMQWFSAINEDIGCHT